MRKSTKNRTISLFIAVAFMVTMFTGLGVTASAKAAKDENVTIQFWTISLQPTFTDFFNGLIKTYETEHPNVTVTWTDLPYDAIQSKLITATAGGTSPDVVNLNTEMALTLAGKGALVDLNKEATAAQKSIYIKTLFNSTKLNNSIYAFPWYGAPSVMIYNKDILKKAGIKTPPTTFDQMLAVAKTVKQKTNAYIYIPDALSDIFFLEDIKILNSDGTKAAFNTSKALALINKYKKATDAGYLPKASWGLWDKQLQQFSVGQLAIINSGAQTLKRIKDEAPNIYKNVAVTTPMVGSAKVVKNAVMNLVVPSASAHHAEAIDFANYITNDANQLAFCKTVQIFPSTIKAAKDPFFKKNDTTLDSKALAIVADELSKTADFSLTTAKQHDIFDVINKIQQACILGSTDPKTALNDAEKKVNQILSEK